MDELNLRFNTGVKYKERLILSSNEINGMWVYDLIEEKLVYHSKFEKEDNCYAIHRKAFLYKDEAWFIPQNGKYIAVVNLLTYEITYMDLPYESIHEKGMDISGCLTYDGGIIEDRYLYIIPAGIDALSIVDLEKRTIKTYYGINKEQDFLAHGFIWGDSIYLYPWTSLRFKILNIKTGEIIVEDYSYGESDTIYGEAVVDEKTATVYIGPGKNNNKITYIDLKNKKKEEIVLNNCIDGECINTELAIDRGEEVLFVGLQWDRVLVLNKDTKRVKTIELSSDRNVLTGVHIGSLKNDVFVSRDGGCLYQYDGTQQFIEKKLKIYLSDLKHIVKCSTYEDVWKLISTDGKIIEEIMPLDTYLKNVFAIEKKTITNTVGDNIYKTIIGR